MRVSGVKSVGFSLVELSIVLVILGLLTGGILAGQSLIRAAELRAVATEFNRTVTAVQTFRDKYFALPGDMTNATSFWTAAASCPGTGSPSATATNATGNGNGNGLIDNSSSFEFFKFWQHLANAGLIEGQYSGLSCSAGYFACVNKTNSLASKLANAVWVSSSEDNSTGSSNGTLFNYYYRSRLLVGGITSGSWPSTPILKPEEAWNIDTKIDDGKPGRGKVTSTVGSSLGSSCTSAATGADFDSAYSLQNSSNACLLNLTYD